jgi:hypothetical protein
VIVVATFRIPPLAVAGGSDAAHGELLSYLFFAPEFTRALFDLGAADAARRIDAESLWD